MTVRVRYAPSPTGEPHVGNIRSALFNWLFARSMNGKFIVRIEDTDQGRLVPGALDSILNALEWLGLDWDEGPEKDGGFGPYVQSQRLHIYREHADWLIQQDKAYYCYCSSERLAEMRTMQQSKGQRPGYDRHCRQKGGDKINESANPPVIRFKMPYSGTITVSDYVRGDVSFEANLLDDFILMKSDGFPTYHLANIVDDHLMEISHVMRAEEWLPSAPRHQELYKAFGYEMPCLVHLPIILGPDRSKLSKRHGATSVLQFRDTGYLPEAMVNFLALLGWSLDDSTEIFSINDLIQHFSIDRILASPSVFNHEKLDWFNGQYIRQLNNQDLAQAVLPWLIDGSSKNSSFYKAVNIEYLESIVPLERERLKVLSEAPELFSFFFNDDLGYDKNQLIQKGMDLVSTKTALNAAYDLINNADNWDIETLENAFRLLAQTLEIKTGQLFGSIRVAITGRTAAPPLFDTIHALGKQRCIERIHKAKECL